MIQHLVQDLQAGVPENTISARFHNMAAQLSLEVSQQLRSQTGVSTVALTGGVWQNKTLLEKTIPLLAADRFTVYIHEKVPANDGGLALGQAVIAYHTLNS
jgi:hydrogenase maturation protein HypF